MLSKANDRRSAHDNSRAGKFLSDLETINKALNADKTLQRLASSTASSRSKSVGKSDLSDSIVKPRDGKSHAKDSFEKEKKSIWSWKSLKALTQVRNRRFNCCFSLVVHSIEGLPAFFDGVCLVVRWKRRDDELTTRPIRVQQGVAEFEEQLTHCCSVYGCRSGPHHSAKYEAKHFLLYASVCDAPDLDLGKHRIDLTRLLPLTLEDLEEEKSSGQWTTSFKLSGKARGAIINVSFGYVVIGNNTGPASNIPQIQSWLQNSKRVTKRPTKFDDMDVLSIRHAESLPSRSSTSNRSAEDIKDLHEVFPIPSSALSDSVNILYQKLDEEMSDASAGKELSPYSSSVDHQKMSPFANPDVGRKNSDSECEINDFSVVEKGIEELDEGEEKCKDDSSKVTQGSVGCLEIVNSIEFTIDENDLKHSTVEDIVSDKDELPLSDKVELPVNACNFKDTENDTCTKQSLMKELESALICASDLVNEGFDSQDDETDVSRPYNNMDANSKLRERRKGKSLSLDDVSKLVASDFFDLLGIEHSPIGLSSESEPESPRERLLRQFEKDSLANGGLLNFDIDSDPSELLFDAPLESVWGTISEDLHHSSICEDFEKVSMVETDAFRSQTKASMLEDMETEALMREWGFNEKAFQHSPPSASGGFGSPIAMLPEDPLQLPPIAEGLGPLVQTKNGGFLRSMNPMLFQNANTGGGLIMQVSNPVVVPAEMGSGVMEILQGLAAIGIEKLSMQSSKLMPLEDITGKTMQQIAWEAMPSLDGPESQNPLQCESEIMQYMPNDEENVKGISSSRRSNVHGSSSVSGDAEYASLEDLAPLAMDKIEALAIEGLRIQSGLSDEDAPSNISTQSIGEFSALKGKTVHVNGSIGLDGTGGLKLLDIKDSGEDVDGLMGLSLTLDEWMKLDSGEIDDDDLVSERTSKILAAHHATSLDMFRGRSKGEKRRGKGRKYGLLGNNFTVGLMVQLRDPLRDYEPVGSPMLALIQVERLFVPPKPKIYSTVSALRNSIEEEEEEAKVAKKDILEQPKEDTIPEELVPQYKITEVHVAGLRTEPGKKKVWGSTNQQQSGSRWLLANGMGNKNKHPLLKSKAVAKAAPQPGDALWSVSSHAQGTGAKWKEHVAQKRHIRNPNVVFG